jgi:6-phosphogluconolactonase/glucosamine-6-phosphate isomerase/deaminase
VAKFTFSPSTALPFHDQKTCERVRKIPSRSIARHRNPELAIHVIPDADFSFRMVLDMFQTIKRAAEESRKLVLITPQPQPLYRWVASLINTHRVDCSGLYTFNMDEYADEDGTIAPETWHNSFLHAMKANFYAHIDESLRPPERQIAGPTNENFADYSKMIADLGGADVCYGGIGWSGHLAFIEPGSPEFEAASDEEWRDLGARIVTLTPTTIMQNCLGPEFGKSGDWSAVPPKAATIGPRDILSAKLRSSWNGFVVGGTQVSWQRFITRLALHGPVTRHVPATLLQTAPSEVYLSTSLASDIVEEYDFSWFD